MFLKYSISLILLTMPLLGLGQQKDHLPTVKLAKFYGDRAAAICYSFDDGLKNQADVALPILDKYGFKGTFFIIPGIIPQNGKQALSTKESINGNISWTVLKAMAANGHEIASHSWSHKGMKGLSDSLLQQEIDKADQIILKQTGIFPVTFAYPYNSFDDRVHQAVFTKHIAAREFQFGIGANFTAQQGNAWADKLIKDESWGIAMIHAISKGFDTLSSPKVLEDHIDYVSRLRDRIWVDTFSALSRYFGERDNTTLTIEQKNQKAVVRMKCPLDTKIYNQPLTIVVNVENVTWAQARQNGNVVPVSLLDHKILVNIQPGNSKIYLKWRNRD
jgi:peptidoglycan/xylan/chitin deacetylase (PgdA/CDA1 family)